MNTITLSPKIAAALVFAQKEARGVSKDARNDYHKYPYASAEAVIDEGRRCLLTADLALFPTSRKFAALDTRVEQANEEGGKRKPPKGAIGRVEMKYTLVHTSGEAVELESGTWVVPEAGRPEDKAEAAAVTNDLAYSLRGLLLLPRGMDTTPIEGRDDRDYTPPASDDRAPAQRQPEPERPAVPPAEVRKAADRAVESQVRGTPANVPIAKEAPEHDPAHVALCEDFERRTLALTPGEDPNPLYDEINAAELPEQLARRAFCSFFVGVFRAVTSLRTLDQWVDFSMKTKWGEPCARILKEESDKADVRLAGAAA